MNFHYDSTSPRPAGTYHVTDDIVTFANDDVRFLAIGGRLIDSHDDDAFDRAYEADRAAS